MNDELKQLIEDAAKLLGLPTIRNHEGEESLLNYFNPCDPDRGDLMKVAMAAKLAVDHDETYVAGPLIVGKISYKLSAFEEFTKGDYQSLAIAVLRAASAVWKARGE